MNFLQESLRAIRGEMLPLLQAHWKEVAFYPDIPLEPDWERYERMEEAGILKLYAVRTEVGDLVGYAAFLVLPSLHYRSQLQATCDVVYLDPQYRGGTGKAFLRWCDRMLIQEGVDLITHHVKVNLDWSPILVKMGYQLMDKILVRRVKRHELTVDTLEIKGEV